MLNPFLKLKRVSIQEQMVGFPYILKCRDQEIMEETGAIRLFLIPQATEDGDFVPQPGSDQCL